MPKRYKVVVSPKAEMMLLEHMRFLSNVSVPAARRFLASFKEAKRQISSFPLSGAYEEEPPLPAERYRKCLFYGRSKFVYEVGTNEAYIDAILDCRQDTDSLDFL